MSQILELAKLAFDGENFEESYQKYSKVIESDFENTEAWIGKALSAAHLSDPEKKKFSESETLLKRILGKDLSKEQKELISNEIIKASEGFVKRTNKKVALFLMEKDKKPMATFEVYAVRNLGQLADRYEAFNNEWENYKSAIGFAKFSLLFNDTKDQLSSILKIVDSIFTESNSHFHKDILNELTSIRNEISSQLKKLDPNYSSNPIPTNSKDGCFIATAIYGDYEAPEVLELRQFRDSVLKNSLLGRFLIRIYYSKSPAIAEKAKTKKWLKNGLKFFLVEPVRFITKLF